MLTGILSQDAKVEQGSVTLDGVELTKLTRRQWRALQGKEIGMIFQEPMAALNPTMQVGKQIEESLLIHTKLRKAERKNLVLQMMREVELPNVEEMYHRYPHELSGGQRQRVMIAAAMILKPKLLIADEPTTALDEATQQSILALLSKLNAQYGIQILFISHNLKVVRSLCSRVMIMRDGTIVESGQTEQIFSHPVDTYTKQLLASNPPIWEKSTLGERKPVLRLKDVCVYYLDGKQKNFVLEDVNLTVNYGEIVGVMGGSGCGKSTLSKCLVGLHPLYEGDIVHDSRAPQMIFQDPYHSLNPRKKIGWILEEPLRVQKKWMRAERLKKVEEILEKVKLPKEVAQQYPRELSGGMRQRVGIALALIAGAKLVVADEALSALDLQTQAEVIALIREVAERDNVAFFFVSHDLDVVNALCERVFYIEETQVKERL
jgi:ABC-type glutathione transport system ATPase component